MLTAPFLGQSFDSLNEAESYVSRYTRQQGQSQRLVGRGGAAPRRYFGCSNRRAVEPMCLYGFVLQTDETRDAWKLCQLSLRHSQACIERQRGATQPNVSSRSELDQRTKSSLGQTAKADNACHDFGRITAMESEHNRECRARYAAKKSITSHGARETSSVFEAANEDDSEAESHSNAESTQYHGKRSRSYRSPTPPTAAFRKKRYIVLSDDDESDHEGEANTTSVGTPPTPPIPIVKQEERDHGAHRPASSPSASREPPVLSHMNTAARSPSTFLDLPDVAVEALAKEGISSVETFRAAKIRLDDVDDVVRALEEGHGMSKIHLAITRKRLAIAIRQFGETA